jgi:hypothetical protein
MYKLFFLKFIIVFFMMTVVCTNVWEAFVDGEVYYCTDPLFGYLSPDGWVGGNNFPIEVVKHIDSNRPIQDSDEIKEGWSIAGLWCLWGTFFAGSLITSFFLARMSWPSSLKELISSRKIEPTAPR